MTQIVSLKSRLEACLKKIIQMIKTLQLTQNHTTTKNMVMMMNIVKIMIITILLESKDFIKAEQISITMIHTL